MNDLFVQMRGPFRANTEIITSPMKKIGIQTKVRNQCKINNIVFEIGKTGLLEFEDVKITSLIFLQDEPESTLVDGIII